VQHAQLPLKPRPPAAVEEAIDGSEAGLIKDGEGVDVNLEGNATGTDSTSTSAQRR
jgi:hypothetical protein